MTEHVTHPNTIAVDLDGVLTEYHEWVSATHFGKPNKSVIDMLWTLRDYGWRIVVFTCRNNESWEGEDYTEIEKAIIDWLNMNSVPFDRLAKASDGKIFATVYLDDRAVYWHPNQDNDEYGYIKLKQILSQAKDYDSLQQVWEKEYD